MIKIVIDAFGGDNSPEEIIIDAIDAMKDRHDFISVLVGKEDKIKEVLSTLSYDKDRVEIVNATDVITCEEEPVQAIRRKPDSSICVAIKVMNEDGNAKVFLSA